MKKINKFFALAAMALATISVSFGQTHLSDYTDASGNLTASLNLPKGTYILDGKVYVLTGQTLRIAAGSVVKATWGQGLESPAIIVARGGKIYAEGTKEEPIIFTSIADPLLPLASGSAYAGTNIEKWGGIILLGKAYNNIKAGDNNAEGTALVGLANGLGFIEGLNYPEYRHQYGADSWVTAAGDTTSVYNSSVGSTDRPLYDNEDNSGVLRYVSIRHGGSEIGVANEINGLTLGSVGSKTVLEHIEVISNGDDGIEFFGGTVNIKHASIMFCEDDYIDYDQGWNGKAQFIYAVMLPAGSGFVRQGDHGIEADGNDYDDRAITSDPKISNLTLICWGGDKGLELKEETRGDIGNAIIAGGTVSVAYDVTGLDAVTNHPDSMWVHDVLFLNCGAPTGIAQSVLETQGNQWLGSIASPNTTVIDDRIAITIAPKAGDTITVQTITNSINPVPNAGDSYIATTYAPWETDEFFDYAPYKGAFEPGVEPWTTGWTAGAYWKADLAASACPNDITKDNQVNSSDLIEVLNSFNTTCND